MAKGSFEAQINQCWDLLDCLELGVERNWFPKLSGATADKFRRLNYFEIWKLIAKNRWYHFQLTDQSLIVFREQPTISYGYFESPLVALTFKEYLRETYGFEDFKLRESDDQFISDYEQYLGTCVVKSSVTPIRYDFDPDRYIPGRHPASHLHIGHENELRLCAKRILQPMSFILFLLRQRYPEYWSDVISSKKFFPLMQNVRDSLRKVDVKYSAALDLHEMALE